MTISLEQINFIYLIFHNTKMAADSCDDCMGFSYCSFTIGSHVVVTPFNQSVTQHVGWH